MKTFGKTNDFVAKMFEKLGRIITRNMKIFLIIPIFVNLLLATGLQNMKLNLSTKVHLSIGGIVDTYQSKLMELFPMDISTNFEPGRLLESTSFGTVIAEATDKGSILRQSTFLDIILLDQEIRNIVVKDGEEWHYEDICAKSNGNCSQNNIILLENMIEQIQNGTLFLEYPISKNQKDYGLTSLGGVRTNQNGYVISAKAIKLFYFLNNKGWHRERIAKQWEKLFIDRIDQLKFKNIILQKDMSSSREESIKEIMKVSTIFSILSMILMLLYVTLSTLLPDFLRSKPWIGVASITAIGMSMGSGFGLLSYIGIEVTQICLCISFLLLGVGMDDSFIMLAAWKKTDEKKKLEDRITEMLSHSGVPITVTSLTNIFSFAVGIIFVKLPSFKLFLIYGTVCLIFNYIYQITFITAVFVLCGKAEERRLHSVVFLSLEKFASSSGKSNLRRIFCYVQESNAIDENKHKIISFYNKFWEKFGIFMTMNISKISVMILYFLYVGIAIWNLSKQSIETSLENNLRKGSYRYSYFEKSREYYNKYQYRLQLIIMQELNYADAEVQNNIEKMMKEVESDPLIAESIFTESWLRSYVQFLSDKRNKLLLTGYNLTNSEDFLFILRHFFLLLPSEKNFNQDIAFDKNFTKIISSRFLIQTNITNDGNHFYKQLVKLRKKLDSVSYTTIIYHPLFYIFDFTDQSLKSVLTTFSVVICVIFLITLLLLTNVICIVSILLSIFSIVGGVSGYMLFFDVNLTNSAVTFIIIMIGFSVDNAVHISSAYLLSNEINPNNRMIKTITLTGMPILQSNISTIMAVILGLLTPDKQIVECIKIVVLTFIICALHGIIFLPVIIFFMDSFCEFLTDRKNKSESNNLNISNCNGEMDNRGEVNVCVEYL